MLGAALIWFGWFGFNAGSALTSGAVACQAFVTTNTSGAAAMITWILIDIYRGRMTSSVGACNGAIVGMVAITPGCGYVTAGGALCIGCIACIVCYSVGFAMKTLSGVDDTLDVFAVHGVGGTCGVILTAIFCSKNVNPSGYDGLVYGNGMQLAKHIAVVLVAVPCIMIGSYGCFALTNFFSPMRVTLEEERIGLDRSFHNESIDNSRHSKKSLDSVFGSRHGKNKQ